MIRRLNWGFSQVLVSIALLIGLAACAAQDAHRQYYRAQKLLEQARSLNPNAPQVTEAEESLVRGKAALDKALYDQAFRNFRETSRLSESVIKPPSLSQPSSMPPAPAFESTPVAEKVETAAATSPLSLPAPRPVEEPKVFEGRSLPKQALAKYLAGKRAAESLSAQPAAKAPASPKPSVKEAPKTSAPVPFQPKLDEGEPELEAQAVNALQAEWPADSAGDGLVKAGAEPLDKITAPSTKEVDAAKESLKQVVKAPAAPVRPKETAKSFGDKPMTKIPGALRFSSNDASIESETMMNLDQTSKYLLDNPSTTLVLRGRVGPGESNSLIDSRFESLRAYLTGKGVPDDQIRLDARRSAGPRGEFEMYIVEH